MAWLTIVVELLGGLGRAARRVRCADQCADGSGAAGRRADGASAVRLHLDKAACDNVLRTQFGPPGYETDLLYLACLAALVMGGAGPWAADTEIARWLRKTPKRSGGSASDARGRATTGVDTVAVRASRKSRSVKCRSVR